MRLQLPNLRVPEDPQVMSMPDMDDMDVSPEDPESIPQFMEWLNRVRATHGLDALTYDHELSESAFLNNKEMHEKGLGHFVIPPYTTQCVGEGTFDQVAVAWMGSRSHFDILMSRSVTRVGFDHDDDQWTVNLSA